MEEFKKQAKMNALKELKKFAQDAMSQHMDGDLKGMQKVTIAADDKPGLKMGLDKAKDMLGHPEDPLEEASESPEEEHKEQMEEPGDHDMTPDMIDEQIQKLLEMKKKLALKE